MNIIESESPLTMVAKTCGCAQRNKRKITYALIDSYHSLCLDKKDIIESELIACERLLKYTSEEYDRQNHRKRNSRTKDDVGSSVLNGDGLLPPNNNVGI